MNLTLRPMSPDDLARYIVTGTEDYIDELVRAGMPADPARTNAAEVMAESFPEGVPFRSVTRHSPFGCASRSSRVDLRASRASGSMARC